MRTDRWKPLLILAAAIGFLACGSGDSDPWIRITRPTTSPTYTQNSTQVTLSGEVEDADFVYVENITTGDVVRAAVDYSSGDGLWQAVLGGMAAGENVIVATADLDDTGRVTATDTITITVNLPQQAATGAARPASRALQRPPREA